jgi:hypothetical protein
MSDLARYFERYRQSTKSRVTRVTDVTVQASLWDSLAFLPKHPSPCKDISRVTQVTDRPDAMPGQDTDGLVTVVTQVTLEPGDDTVQEHAVRYQQITDAVTRVTHVTREIDRGRIEPTDRSRCAHCGEGDRSGAMVVPFGPTTAGHTWLHSQCWREWYSKRLGGG